MAAGDKDVQPNLVSIQYIRMVFGAKKKCVGTRSYDEIYEELRKIWEGWLIYWEDLKVTRLAMESFECEGMLR